MMIYSYNYIIKTIWTQLITNCQKRSCKRCSKTTTISVTINSRPFMTVKLRESPQQTSLNVGPTISLFALASHSRKCRLNISIQPQRIATKKSIYLLRDSLTMNRYCSAKKMRDKKYSDLLKICTLSTAIQAGFTSKTAFGMQTIMSKKQFIVWETMSSRSRTTTIKLLNYSRRISLSTLEQPFDK